MKSKRPLVQALQSFVAKYPISLHVPGHKNGTISNTPEEIKIALKYDLTELSGLDDLHHPEEAILEAEQLLAKTYHADHSFFLINGSTVGNLAMIYATCKRNEKIIVQRNAHKSIFHAIELVGAKAIFVSPDWDKTTRTATAVSFTTLKEALSIHKDVKAVVLTYPTYYGVVAKQLQEQIAFCHSLNIPVLVDEAHGAHFTASNQFPMSSLDLGADIVVQSAHKTLPAMTMASFLHVKSKRIDIEKVKHYLHMLQSSSPSYLLLASLDDARSYIQSYEAGDGAYLLEQRKEWITNLRSIASLEVIEVDDPLKLLLRVSGYTGFQLQKELECQGVFVELADLYQVLIILPLLKKGFTYPFEEISSRIKRAMKVLLKKEGMASEIVEGYSGEMMVSTSEYCIEELEAFEKEWISYTDACGKISASMLIPYPPGVPLFVSGEKVTVSKLQQLEKLLTVGAAFQGQHRLNEKLICVIKE